MINGTLVNINVIKGDRKYRDLNGKKLF